MLAGPPSRDVAVPLAVSRLAAGCTCDPVWQNEFGGLTFELVGHQRFVKWSPASSPIDLRAEAVRMRWARTHIRVPDIVGNGADDEGSWLVTTALAGASAVSDRWKADPANAVEAIGRGLRQLHDQLPVDTCPFSWDVPTRIGATRLRAGANGAEPLSGSVESEGIAVADAVERLADPPAIDRLVVCHGDACAPNTIIAEDGSCAGHVDLDALGVADRWADLAVATWSTQWNYGPGWESPLLEAYGIAPDPERTAYYRLLWEASP